MFYSYMEIYYWPQMQYTYTKDKAIWVNKLI